MFLCTGALGIENSHLANPGGIVWTCIHKYNAIRTHCFVFALCSALIWNPCAGILPVAQEFNVAVGERYQYSSSGIHFLVSAGRCAISRKPYWCGGSHQSTLWCTDTAEKRHASTDEQWNLWFLSHKKSEIRSPKLGPKPMGGDKIHRVGLEGAIGVSVICRIQKKSVVGLTKLAVKVVKARLWICWSSMITFCLE